MAPYPTAVWLPLQMDSPLSQQERKHLIKTNDIIKANKKCNLRHSNGIFNNIEKDLLLSLKVNQYKEISAYLVMWICFHLYSYIFKVNLM